MEHVVRKEAASRGAFDLGVLRSAQRIGIY